MSDLKLPGDDQKKPAISWQRIAVWVVVGGVAIYLIITGLAGVIAKG
ncbi:MAG TPA: hypothetical protein VF479_00675 [Pseudolysinimonas sp.]